MKKAKIVIVSIFGLAAVAVIGGVGLLRTSIVNAAEATYPQIVQNIAAKFGVNQSDVAQVFTETKAQRETERLNNAVSEGVITEDQKTLIVAKQTEIEAKIAEIDAKSLTATERHDQMKAVMDEVRTWADTNDIPMGLVRGGRGARGGMGMGMGMGREDGGMMGRE